MGLFSVHRTAASWGSVHSAPGPRGQGRVIGSWEDLSHRCDLWYRGSFLLVMECGKWKSVFVGMSVDSVIADDESVRRVWIPNFSKSYF